MRLSVADAATEAPDRPALIDDRGTLGWADVAAQVEARAGAIGPEGGRVLVVPTPSREGALSLLTLLDRRVPFVLAHPRWTAAERAGAIARTDPSVVLEDDRVVERRVDAARAEGPQVIAFTSGSTGRPKGVCLSRAALEAAGAAHHAALPWRPDDRWLLAMPLAHVGGLAILARALWARGTVVIGPPRFDPAPLVELVERHRVTLLSVVPTMLERLLALGRRPASLRAVLVGGAACRPELLARGRDAGWPLLPTYGLTEACAQVCTQRLDDRRPEGVGPPLPGLEVRVEAEQIEIRGPTLMDGFLDEPTPWREGGWYPTGDLGSIDEAGHLHVRGRADDRIITGGENVDPLEIESVLAAHPGVRSACVVGLPDPVWGQVVAAAVEGDVEQASLERYVEARLASFKRPRRWAFVDQLPLGPSGKVDRRAVASWLGQ